nr:4-alpha-glucanotransferase [Gemmatimonadota bacterium]
MGGIGPPARAWVDWLAGAGQRLWQILPLVPVGQGGSPYNGLSAFAGNPLLVGAEGLVADGLLRRGEIDGEESSGGGVDYSAALLGKEELLARAFGAFRGGAAPALRAPFAAFVDANASWLADYALFRALREEHGGAPWSEWEAGVRLRRVDSLERAADRLAERVEFERFQQFLFDRQWRALREYALAREVRI